MQRFIMGQKISDRYKPTINKLLTPSPLKFVDHCGRADTSKLAALYKKNF